MSVRRDERFRLQEKWWKRLPDRPRDIERLDDLMTIKMVTYMFRCTEMTITKWREKKGLPYVIVPGDGRDAIRFRFLPVRIWARRTGKKYRVPQQVLEARHEQHSN